MAKNPPVPPNPPAPPAPPSDPSEKLKTPAFMAVLNELNVNSDQLAKRQKLIAEIEQALTAKYNSPNRLMSYVMRFGHARTMMQTGDITNTETQSRWGRDDHRKNRGRLQGALSGHQSKT